MVKRRDIDRVNVRERGGTPGVECGNRKYRRQRTGQCVFELAASLLLLVSVCGCAGSPDTRVGIFDAKSATYYRELHASLLESGSPTDRLLAAMSRTFFVDGSPVPSEPSPTDMTLLDSVIHDAPSDPMLIWYVASKTSDQSTKSVLVSRLQKLEPHNGAIGMLRLTDAVLSNDPLRTTEAIEQIGMGRRFNEHFGDLTIAWLDAVRRYPRPTSSVERTESVNSGAAIITALSYASSFGFPAYMDLSNSCRSVAGDPARPARDRACLAAAEAMISGSDTLISRTIGNSLLRRFDERRYQINLRNFTYQNESFRELTVDLLGDTGQISLIEADWRQTRSELRVMECALKRANISLIPPDDWKPAPGSVWPRADSASN